MIKKREIDIFGILLGVVIGCILGFFLSTRIDVNQPLDGEPVVSQVGNVYLLQIDKISDATAAQNKLSEILSKDLFAVVVYSNDYYYIYGGISNSESGLEMYETNFQVEGYTTIIKKEYIMDRPNSVIEDEAKYAFWMECINNLIDNLEGKSFVISEAFLSDPINLEVITSLLGLQNMQSASLQNRFRLNAYKTIVESLG